MCHSAADDFIRTLHAAGQIYMFVHLDTNTLHRAAMSGFRSESGPLQDIGRVLLRLDLVDVCHGDRLALVSMIVANSTTELQQIKVCTIALLRTVLYHLLLPLRRTRGGAGGCILPHRQCLYCVQDRTFPACQSRQTVQAPASDRPLRHMALLSLGSSRESYLTVLTIAQLHW